MAGTLYVVATPIGNLEDITFRAVRVLQEADLIASEDTRHTRILLTRYEINTPLTSYHKFNIRAKTGELVGQLQAGKNIALVSDAGTPGVSDPGYQMIRESVDRGIKVEVIPGPSAAIAALVGSGLPTDEFTFVGFLPRKPGRKRRKLEQLKNEGRTIIIYESPFRVVKTLEDVHLVFGEVEVAVCRELTKKFEEFIRGNIEEVIVKLKNKKVRGEIVLVVSAQAAQRESIS
ncbi:16S rRNA (cytidine(1402)-2'-O)-methyltransferase [candidate division WOR-1 bacterium RIFCSPHIGHO2_01_FULL_53_15]|uniref:Ribosomal RNA small subunit methyltransferase I n=1 Tax=candidate division WOR-1 bacterium RIFCSPHIGHO2_01_FULL_53_15 TaxID=1802564 RepID=A0A1F4Q248_UNCSA|nr:MAG: 16S rRNA (cytidine(1402)-2'-O)-methyltransferase [candidate division WOR-1 bacterium RIFCSPHIGHO2_01_FULL_53_15]OGC13643.1 MAG: 16S rRNA (cytidine(1402)-2'-O)-methyltransferase [candidate division WOR-1 bacterium RIFCSPHIGHO2_02_FULL_53_26]